MKKKIRFIFIFNLYYLLNNFFKGAQVKNVCTVSAISQYTLSTLFFTLTFTGNLCKIKRALSCHESGMIRSSCVAHAESKMYREN